MQSAIEEGMEPGAAVGPSSARAFPEDVLTRIIASVAGTTGGAFFRRLSGEAARALGASVCIISERTPFDGSARVSGAYTRSGAAVEDEFSAQATALDDVLARGPVAHAAGARAAYPADQRLQRLYVEAYAGVPVTDGRDDVIGFIEMMWDDPREMIEAVLPLLEVLSDRCAVELERNQAEAALRDSELRYRALIEDSFHLVAEIVDERFVYVGPGYKETLGYAPEDLLGGSIFDLIHAEDRRTLSDELRAMALEQRAAHCTVRSQHAAGGWRWLEASARTFRTSTGEHRTTVFSRDITERLKHEESLRESEARFRTLVNDLQVGVVVHGPGAEVLHVNGIALDLLGLTEEQMLGTTSFDPSWNVVDEQGRDMPGEHHPSVVALRTGAPVRDVAMGVYRPATDDRVWLLVSAEPRRGTSGEREVVVTFSDITRRREIEEALRASEERFRVLAENATDVIGRYDAEGRCTWISPSATAVLGFAPDDIIGRTLQEMSSPGFAMLQPATEVIDNEPGVSTTIFRAQRKDGREIWMESTNRIVREPGTDRVIEILTSARDITWRREIEEALRRSEHLFRATLDSTADGIIVTEPGGELLYWNERSVEILDIPPGVLAARDARALIHHVVGRAVDGEGLREQLRQVSLDAPLNLGLWSTVAGKRIEAYARPLNDAGGSRLRVWTVRDVTEKERAESALRESEERYRSLAEHTSDLVMDIKGPGLVEYVSPNCRVLLGRAPEEIIGANALDLTHPDDIPGIVLEFEKAAQAGVPASAVLRVLMPDGGARWFDFTANFYYDDENGLRAVVTARDITNRKLAEDALRESEERLRSVISGAPLALIATDAGGTITLAEGPALEVVGVRPEELVGRSYLSVYEEYPRTLDFFARALRGEEFSAMDTIAGTTFEAHFRPWRGVDGNAAGVIAVGYDITARMRAEDALRDSEETARALLNAPTDGAVLVDRDGTILAFNQTAERRFREHAASQGVVVAGFLGRCVFDLFPPELRDQRRARNDEVFATGERRHFEDERGGVWTDVTIDPIFDRDGNVARIAIFSRDITDRKQDEAALRKRSLELEALNNFLEKTYAELEKSQEELREATEQLAELLEAEQARSKTDLLTGVLNHGAIADVIAEAIASEISFAVAMVDVDGMKSVNDTYGHQAGDAVLLAVTSALERPGAIVGRYGGDEFIAALLNADAAEAEAYKAAVDAALAAAQVVDPETGARVPVVASVGIALYPGDASNLAALIEHADERMYEEKKKQRNGTGLSSSRTFDDERTARMVGELVPLLVSDAPLDEKLRLVAHRLSIGAGYAGVNFDVFGDDAPEAEPSASIAVQNAFSRAPEELLEAWNRHQRSGANQTGVSDVVRASGKPVTIPDIDTSPYVTDEQKKILAAVGIRSGVVVPLSFDDTMIATMSVGRKELDAFGQQDVQFLSAVASQVAAIIRMARLVEELQQAARPSAENSADMGPAAEAA